jgi:CYTH domain-containing protein
MEIERKFLITAPPSDLGKCSRHLIEQGYLNTEPVVRIRREDDTYYLTYKGAGLMAHEEYNLPLTAKAYEHLKEKVDGCLISKTRYLIPYEDGLTIELDYFHSPREGLYLAEVEFESVEQAQGFVPPEWFREDVTGDPAYHNSVMSKE